MLTRADVLRQLVVRIVALFAVLLTALAASIPARASMLPGSGIAGSPHDFTATTGGSLCAICHATAGRRAGPARPPTGAGSAYGWSRTQRTAAGTLLPSSGVGDPTAVCLGCHDGTIADGDWALRGASPGPGFHVSRGAVASGGSLEGNHPVSVPYPAGGTRNTYRNRATGSHISLDQYVSDPTPLGILLYQDSGDGTVSAVKDRARSANYGIECSSCHDVHNGPAVQDRYLLRGKLTGSGRDNLCFKCHMM